MSNIAALADAYAALKFEESNLAARINAVKAEIYNTGEKEIVGDTCVVAVVERKGSSTIDKAAAVALLTQLGATTEQIASVMKLGNSSVSLMIKPKLSLAV